MTTHSQLKEQGNKAFKAGDLVRAEDLFSQAYSASALTTTITSLTCDRISKNPHEPTYFTNRALTRLRLSLHAAAEHDARAAISLYGPKNPSSLKASSYLTQSLLGQNQPQEAYDVAIDAYRACLALPTGTGKSSAHAQAEKLSSLVLRSKQALWAVKETDRIRGMNETLATVERLIESDLSVDLDALRRRAENGELGRVGLVEDSAALKRDAEAHISNVRAAFAAASVDGEIGERVVPDYLVDGITFEIMHDPVVTPSGSSFDRVGIVKYIEQAGVDPITRVGVKVGDLRPNLALREACEEFLGRNGWAVDW